ncbi:PAS domain S-box protein [Shewanella sp. SP2S2-6]|uniref:PAS domain S-box protein n=1 Tax=Shewanella sp. SP2S2-6 TaxID=3063540 RepID=UPI00288DF41F|nr:PAS domain S-box protein [Shewanella sp. SP2S2-6]MDT3295535.1 PAS domain S-box protein [Shewanella sp. SP2S2-6]
MIFGHYLSGRYLNRSERNKVSFRLKTIVGIALIEALLLFLLVYTSINYLKLSNQSQIEKRAQTTLTLFSIAAKDAVISNDIATLQTLVEELLTKSEVLYVTVSDPSHILAYGGADKYVQVSHQPDTELAQVQDGIFDLEYKIEDNGYRFGTINMGFETRSLDDFIQLVTTKILSIAGIEILLVALFSLLLGHYLTRNLTILTNASKRILAGELGVRIPVKGKDEIAQMGKAFNNMIDKVDARTKALEAANIRLNTILDSAVDGFVIINDKGTITDINPAISRLFGYAHNELIGQNVAIFLPFEMRSSHDGFIHQYLETGVTQIIGTSRELMAQRKDGQLFPIALSVSLMKIDNKVMFIGLVKDLSDVKRKEVAAAKTESVLLATLAASLDSLITIDIDGRVVEFNLAATRLFGYSRHEAIGRYLEELIIPKSQHSSHRGGMERYRQTGSGNIINKRIELLATCKAGNEIPIELEVVPIKLGNEILFTAFLRDISERKASELKLQLAKEQAELGNKVKSRFLATMSHEIRSPLNAILGGVELLLHSKLNKEQRIHANITREAGSALLNTINDILDFSKIEAGQMVLESNEFEPDKLVAQVLQILEPKAYDKGLQLVSFVDRNVPQTLLGDRQRLNQVIHNLVDNAIKFSVSGTITVEMWIADNQQSLMQLFCRVTDSGIGISEEAQSKLFKEFSQVHDTHNTNYKGTGLGLAICRELITMMGGEIELESELDKGCCFTFYVSLQPHEANYCHSYCPPTKSRVMLAHTDLLWLSIVSKQYSQYGIETVVVNSWGEIKEESLLLGRFDLVLLDETFLFEVDKNEINWLKQTNLSDEGTLVALVSAMSSEISQSLSNIGLDQVVNKPLSRSMQFALLSQDAPSNEFEEVYLAESLFQGHILLAEDSPANQIIAGTMLTKAGFDVTYACNGVEAVKLMNEKAFDLVLMDIRMPEMDGLEASHIILSTNPNQIILAMTANVMKEEVEQCYLVGMKDFISKPVNQKMLLSIIQKWLPNASITLPIISSQVKSFSQNLLDEIILSELSTALGKDSLSNMMAVFCKELLERVATLTVLDPTQFELIEDQAHTLKSSSGSFGAVALFLLAQQLESSARNKQTEIIYTLIKQVAIIGKETHDAFMERFIQ